MFLYLTAHSKYVYNFLKNSFVQNCKHFILAIERSEKLLKINENQKGGPVGVLSFNYSSDWFIDDQ